MNRIATILTLAALAVAGCAGSDEPASEPTSTPTSTPTEEPTEEPSVAAAPTPTEASEPPLDPRTLASLETWWAGGTTAQHNAFCMNGIEGFTSFAEEAVEIDPAQDVYTIMMFLLDKCGAA